MVHEHYQLPEQTSVSSVCECLTSIGKVERGPTTIVKSKYYDTFDWRLFASGKSVSVRRGGSGPELQFLNYERNKLIAVVPGGLPTGLASDFPSGQVRDLVADIIDVRRLLVRFKLRAKRTSITVRHKKSKEVLRVWLDSLTARNPDGTRSASLGTSLTIESLPGDSGAMARMPNVLRNGLAARPSKTPLDFEALKAIGVTPGDYCSKQGVDLLPHMTASEAVRLIHQSLLNTIRKNEDGVADNIDPEFLHDFRVAVRRTRAALAQLDKGVLPADVRLKAKVGFRWIGKQTNHMRDLDVFLIEYPALRSSLPDQYQPSLQPFHDYLTAQSRAESRKIAKMIRSRRYREICEDWHSYLTAKLRQKDDTKQASASVMELANSRIWKAYNHVIRNGQTINDASPPEALHDLRIDCKKLRYLLEFLRSLYPSRRVERLIKPLKGLQDVLGEFQDTELQAFAILDIGRKMADAKSLPAETQIAMGMVADQILHRQRIARSEFANQFRAFSRQEVQRSFGDMLGREP